MKYEIHKIPDHGLDIDLKDETLILDFIETIFKNENLEKKSIKGKIHLQRFDHLVTLNGQLHLDLYPECNRCLDKFKFPLHLNLHTNFSPLFTSSKDKSKHLEDLEEIELSKEDLNFNFYEGDQINLEPVINDSLLLELPVQFTCKEDCKGLCSICGSNLNLNACDCHQNQAKDLRFQSLENLKKNLSTKS